MGKFSYCVHDKEGDTLEGVLEAASESHAQKFLLDRHYEIVRLKPLKEGFRLEALLNQIETVKPADFNFFVRQLATLLKAGVPMLTALRTLKEGIKDRLLKATINTLYRDIENGSSFSEAMQRHPRVFNSLFITTVRSGEASGELDSVLIRLAQMLERDYQTRSKIKSALSYPIIAFCVMVLAFLVSTLFIIPQFKDLFMGFGVELPLPTRILLATSEAVTKFWYITLVAGALVCFGVYKHYQTRSGKRFWDARLLQLWLIGDFLRNAIFARFARMLGMMLQSGVPILQGLQLIADIVGNAVMHDAILRIRDKVSEGENMGDAIREEPMFTTIIAQVVHVGEESGKMDELLIQIAGFYDTELDTMTKNIESLIEPIFILILGVLVTIMAIGIFLPMWNLYGVIQQSATA